MQMELFEMVTGALVFHPAAFFHRQLNGVSVIGDPYTGLPVMEIEVPGIALDRSTQVDG